MEAANSGYEQGPSVETFYSSETPPGQQNLKDPAVHLRTYQACIPCRRRKVRCDLGSVDQPHDPPCLRCKRESKECFFSSTRRKKKNGGAEEDTGTGAVGDEEEVYEIKSGKKRLRTSLSAQLEHEDDGGYDEDEVEQPRTPGGSRGRQQPLRRPAPARPVQYGEEEHKASDQTAAMLQVAEVHGGHDALKVLYEAAAMRDRLNSNPSGERPSFSDMNQASLPMATSPVTADGARLAGYNSGLPVTDEHDSKRRRKSSHWASTAAADERALNETASYNAALKAWSRQRFVRAGWFTAKEGIDYVLYFYQHLAPLTPVAIPDFKPYDTHERLLVHEPMLSVTMLLVASRHMKLKGPGATSRPYMIHDKLWKYLSGMINRVVWGQEQFAGGLSAAGSESGADVNPLTRKGLRTLGTVESLVLLTEWHPRAMHFPPDDADEQLMIPDQPVTTPESVDNNEEPKGIGGQRMDAWLEPCWRSDRMCWMLLGMAMSLAFEIGVFDTSDWQRHVRSMNGEPLSAAELQTYDMRRKNVRDLLLVYVTQTSGRLGLTSMLPGNYIMPEASDLFKRQVSQLSSVQETVLYFWLRIAAMIRDGNQKLFANKAFTRDLIKNGDYKAALEQLQVPLLKWKEEFDKCLSIPKYMRYVLIIEYEYCHVYLNALALQAVAERCANEDPMAQMLEPPIEMARSAISTNGVRSDVAIAPQTLAKWLGGDRKYMLAVGDAARNLLTVVVDGLYPGEYLRHAPVRTYFRIISVAIMLLKSFSLGACESEVAESLTLMDRTVKALKTCVVDDVHVASRFAELLEMLTQSLKPRLVRISADGRTIRPGYAGQRGNLTPAFAPRNTTSHSLPVQQIRQQQPPQQQAVPGAMSAQQPWSFPTNSNYVSPNYPSNNNNNPLLGISSDSYDLLGNDFSVMPPPNFGLSSPSGTNLSTTGYGTYTTPGTSTGTYGADPGMQDWLTLPLDNILNLPGAEVNQTMYGPQFGDQDMLELLLGGGGTPGQQNGYGSMVQQNGYG